MNARFSAMASHYLFDAEFCNPASGWEKGQVEKNVQDIRHRLWQTMQRFPTPDALNDWLEQCCIELRRETPHGVSHPRSRWLVRRHRLTSIARDGDPRQAERAQFTLAECWRIAGTGASSAVRLIGVAQSPARGTDYGQEHESG